MKGSILLGLVGAAICTTLVWGHPEGYRFLPYKKGGSSPGQRRQELGGGGGSCEFLLEAELGGKQLVENCAAQFKIPSELLSTYFALREGKPSGGPPPAGPEQGRNETLLSFEPQWNETEPDFRQFLTNLTNNNKKSKQALESLSTLRSPFPPLSADITSKVMDISCFAICTNKEQLGKTHPNGTVDLSVIKERLNVTSKGTITSEIADKLIEHCYKRSNIAVPIELPEGNTEISTQGCRDHVNLTICIARHAWQTCRYLSAVAEQ